VVFGVRVGVGACCAQAPQQGNGGDDLDARVDSEADECDRAGYHTGADGHERFDDVPRDGEVLQPQRPAVQPLLIGRA
jgi:hypothetical protein